MNTGENQTQKDETERLREMEKLNAYLIVFSLEPAQQFLLGRGLPLNLKHRKRRVGWFHITNLHKSCQSTTRLTAD